MQQPAGQGHSSCDGAARGEQGLQQLLAGHMLLLLLLCMLQAEIAERPLATRSVTV